MDKLYLEIVTPEKTSFSGEVDKIFATTPDGMIGVLPKHTSLFTQLSEGELKIVINGEDNYYSIGGGFLEVVNNKVRILVTRAVAASELVERQIDAAKKKAEQVLAAKPEGEMAVSAQAVLRRSLIDLKVARKIRKRKPKLS